MTWKEFPKFVFRKKRDMPNGLWMRCDECSNLIYKKVVEEGLMTCPECNFHFTIAADERIKLILDENSFEEMWQDIEAEDPLDFVSIEAYKSKLEKAKSKLKINDGLITGKGKINGIDVLIGIVDSRFMMGSMGSVFGEKITRLFELGLETKYPIIVFAASGGARMQEGALSLMQMAKTSAAVLRYRKNGGFFVSFLTNPTFAGVMASFASLGDLVLAEPKSLIGFTGPRVIQQTIKQELPKGFQKSEFLLEKGFIDIIISRNEMKDKLTKILKYYVK